MAGNSQNSILKALVGAYHLGPAKMDDVIMFY